VEVEQLPPALVADLPRTTLSAGGKVAVVNRTSTWVDGRAELILRGSAGDVLEAVAVALTGAG